MGNIQLRITNPNKHFGNVPEGIEPPKQSRYTESDKAKLMKASKDFESMLTRMMLKSMTEQKDGMFGESEDDMGGDTFAPIFQDQLASYMTDTKGLGIAETIYKKMTGEELPSDFGTRLKPTNSPFSPVKTTRDSETKTETKTPIKPIVTDGSVTTVTPPDSALDRLNGFEDIIREAADTYRVPPNLIKSIILTESLANPNAKSYANAKGLMQLIDSTARSMGVTNVWDPKDNIFGGSKYISQMMERYNGDVKLALAAYNAGPGNVDKYNGVPPFTETQNYVARVMGYLKYFEKGS